MFFSQLPADKQFIPRDEDNTGTFWVKGKIQLEGFSEIKSQICDANGNVLEEKISMADINHEFGFYHKIQAGNAEYSLNIFLTNNTAEIPVKTVSSLVCGDVILIFGQSNAAAPMDEREGYSQNRLYSTPFNRSLGHSLDFALANNYPFEIEYAFNHSGCILWQNGFAGSWGLKLQNRIAQATGIPLCLVNGAASGSDIQFNLPSHTPSNPNLLNEKIPYDRTLKKLQRYGLDKYVKAIYWYQGEADAAYSREEVLLYADKFSKLYKGWKTDYKSLQKVFVIQINTGCGGKYNDLLADEQRKMVSKFTDVVLFSSVGSDTTERSSDACHYTLKGYNKLADKLLPVSLSNLYGFRFSEDTILPPLVKSVFTSDQNKICVEFDKKILIQNYITYGADTVFLKDHFFDQNGERLKVSSLSVHENKLYLTFDDKLWLPEYITYLPPNYSKINRLYAGPWVFNANQTIGACSFKDVEVEGYVKNIKENLSEPAILAYPSITKDYIKLFIAEDQLQNSTISVYNSQGQLLRQLSTKESMNTLSLSEYSNGVYTVTLRSTKGVFSKKVVVIR